MELFEQAEIKKVENNSDRVTFTCLKKDIGKVVDVVWRKGDYDSVLQEVVPNDAKTEQVNEWCKQYFDLDLMTINKAVGRKIDVYVYDTFASFWESDTKFTLEDVGKEFDTEILDIKEEPERILVQYMWNGNKYHTKYSFTQKVGTDFFVNPQKQRRQEKRFEELFGLPLDRKDELIGLPITVKVCGAFKKFAYGEISIKK